MLGLVWGFLKLARTKAGSQGRYLISSEEGEKQRTNVEYRESKLTHCCHPYERGSGKRRRRGSLGRKELDSEMTTRGDSDFGMKKGCF